MHRFNLPYYMYDRNYYPVPYRYCQGYQCIPYFNFINSNFANTNQSIYNSGYMTDVFQNSNIWQSGVGMCTSPSGLGVCTTPAGCTLGCTTSMSSAGIGTTDNPRLYEPIIIPGPGPITEPLISENGPQLTFNL